jgi:hypothetical protein
MRKRLSFLLPLLIFVLMALPIMAFGHSGRTDSSGGHNDRKYGTGYHYHHGYPAHQHTGGVCPYTQSNSVYYNPSNSYASQVKTFVPYTMSQNNVIQIQQKLQEKGYDPKGIDGKYGPNTRAAVIRFQTDNGLQVDGIVGPQTRAALGL